MNAAVDRRFLAILGLSLALHASLFALTSWQRKHGTIALPPILASIRLLNVSEPGPVAAAPSAQPPATVPQKVRQPSPRVGDIISTRATGCRAGHYTQYAACFSGSCHPGCGGCCSAGGGKQR